ncbi:HET domain-containing protein [Fusarium falciforme]|uniref:HET domain-containing protein n=1 Tax=Fusarium falciforme TaxID=195108 RepID=UPI002301DC10|nr:HET domain-containing protein [Fusarium falciforme]WAO92355.1 HET domain-containing protein [Fusarium falciforme]
MYHNRKATDRRDKVYALLGMSSDDYIPADLSPNYGTPWKHLLHRLVKFLLGEQASVETWEEKETAVIKSMGCILGEVSSVERGGDWSDRQTVHITSKNTPAYLGQKKKWSDRWALHTTVKSIRKGDVACLLQGASKPTIIRPYEDYCAVIAIAVTTDDKRIEGLDIDWPGLLRSITIFPRDFLLVWDWEAEDDECLMSSRVPKTDLKSFLDKAGRLRNMGLILGDLEKYEEAEKNLRKVINAHERAPGKELSHTLAAMDDLALMCGGGGDWKRAKKLGVMADLLGRRGDYAQITEEGMIRIARSFGQELMTLLLDWREDEVKITEEVVEAAARNRSGKEVMALLLDRCGDGIIVTPGLVQTLTKSFNALAMTKLLDQRGPEVKITEEVIEAAAGNHWNGKEVMALLLDQRGSSVKITEQVAKAAVRNSSTGIAVMALLLDRCGDGIIVTPGLVQTLTKSFNALAMTKLLDQRGPEVKITEEVVKAAAGSHWNGEQVMALLLKQRGPEVKITEEVLKEAASNEHSGYRVIKFLHQTIGIKFTAGLIEAAATSGQEEVLWFLDQCETIGSGEESWLKISRLYNAAKNGDAAAVRKLIHDGTPPDKQNIRGVTPLWTASSHGHKAVVQVLLATNAVGVNVRTVAGQTPLFRAAANGHSEVVKLLLDHGAERNYTDKDGRSPLSVAQLYHQPNVIDILTTHDAQEHRRRGYSSGRD